MSGQAPSAQPDALAHIYWIGGSPCAGKSTIADLLGSQFGWYVYHVDAHNRMHQVRATTERQPTFVRLNSMGCDELWMRPRHVQVRDAIAHCAEEFDLIIADLLALPRHKPIIAEGVALLPHLVAPLLRHARQAIWIVPTADFQHHHYAQRTWVQTVLSECTEPETAFQNWMARDVAFAQWVQKQTNRLGLPHLVMNGTQTPLDSAAQIARSWDLPTMAAQ